MSTAAESIVSVPANATGFAGTVTVFTSIGACRLHDLARLVKRRQQMRAAWDAKIENIRQQQAEALARFDAAHDQAAYSLRGVDTSAWKVAQASARTSLQIAHEQVVARESEAADAECEGMVPLVKSLDGLVHVLDIALEPETITEVVNVLIASTPIQIKGPDGDVVDGIHESLVTCSPDTIFVVEGGTVEAEAASDWAILSERPDGTRGTTTAAARPVSLSVPIQVFRVSLDGADTMLVGADGEIGVFVRCG